jgi:outer membrane immunogenic protein
MKNLFRSASVLALLVSPPAMAADIYTGGSIKDGPVPSSYEAFRWSGFYVGAHAGFGVGDANSDMTLSNEKDSIALPSIEDDLDGAIYGVHLGFNAQNGRLVFGIEGSLAGTNIDGTGSSQIQGIAINNETEVDLLGRLVGRVGIASDRTLFYVDGGVAYVDSSTTTSISDGINSIALGENDESQWGWTLGAGIEHALTDGWIARVAYAHYEFSGEKSSNGVSLDGRDTGITFTNDRDLELDTVTVGISRKW